MTVPPFELWASCKGGSPSASLDADQPQPLARLHTNITLISGSHMCSGLRPPPGLDQESRTILSSCPGALGELCFDRIGSAKQSFGGHGLRLSMYDERMLLLAWRRRWSHYLQPFGDLGTISQLGLST